MVAADHPSALPGHDVEMAPESRTTDPEETPTGADDGGLRRRHPGVPPREPTSASIDPPLRLIEEARPLGCVSRYDVVKDRMYALLYAAAIFSSVFLLSGIASTLLGWRLGTALTFTGLALVVACWVVFLCTCAERSRTFLLTILPSFVLGCRSAEDDGQLLCDASAEDIAFASGAAVYTCT
ncbi:hypothetical protein MRX96_032728 [Rhipicephalus microplus]